jgi:hypothetical protein
MIQLPHKREELIYYLTALADPVYQHRVWLKHEFPPGIVYDCFDYAVNFFFDDTALADAPQETIGWILENEEEMQAVSKVINAVDEVLNKLGTELTDEQYINSPEWQSVIESAKAALLVLKNPQPDR